MPFQKGYRDLSPECVEDELAEGCNTKHRQRYFIWGMCFVPGACYGDCLRWAECTTTL